MFSGMQLSSKSGAMPHSKQIHAKIAAVPVTLEGEFESVQIMASEKASWKYFGFTKSNGVLRRKSGDK
jgi:hypothetical protein